MLEKVTLKQILTTGGLGGLAILFAYQLSEGQVDTREALAKMEQQHVRMIELAEQSSKTDARVLRVLQITCVNQAQTAEARRLCLSDDGLVTR